MYYAMACCECCRKNRCKINLNEPRCDQESYLGRARYFFSATNPVNFFVSNKRLRDSDYVVNRYLCEDFIPKGYSRRDLWKAKTIYDSAFDPVTGKRKFLLTRPSSYVYCKTLLFGGMLMFYKSIPALALWQTINQGYNALIHSSNRNDELPISNKQIATSFVAGTATAIFTSVALKKYLTKVKSPGIAHRLVPFGAVAAATIACHPFLRAQELKQGRPIYDDSDKIALSKVAAHRTVTNDIFNKIFRAAPPLIITPFVMDCLEKRGTLCRHPWLTVPLPLGLLFFCLAFLSPLCGAFFKPKKNLPFKYLEPGLRCRLTRQKYCCKSPYFVYYKLGYPIPY